jgi:MFS family permease
MSNTLADKKTLQFVIGASSLGTLIEWYDFYIFGTLTAVIGKEFFPADNPNAQLLAALAAFAAGFLVRPFGAIVFGRLGDLVGRKYTFLVTLLLMGLSTVAIGCVPSYKTIGFAAPVIILLLRFLQGLALGGEYGGAATYVSEHTDASQRGFYTSWIQTTATLGLFLALAVIFFTKKNLGDAEFAAWGWRIPFWVSAILLAVSVYIRLRMAESPMFAKVKSEGKASSNPLKESFGNKLNFKYVLLALFGATMGQGVVWYTGQFYANSFLQNTMKIEDGQRTFLMLTAIALATPFFIVFASWSDKVGRKWIMMAGMAIAVCSYFPIYQQMLNTSDAKLKTAVADKTFKSVTVAADAANTADSLRTTSSAVAYTDGTVITDLKKEKLLSDRSKPAPKAEVTKKVYLSTSDWWKNMWLVWIQIIFVTMAYGPIAAFLVELFPTRIRYTSMSLPYHVGNGIFGGLTPFVATALSVTGYLNGLWYPILIGGLCCIIGSVFLTNTIRPDAED